MIPEPGTLIRFTDTGRTATVTHLTARGFAYRDNDGSLPFIARWGMFFRGEGEIFTDISEWEHVLETGLYEILDNHINPLDHEQMR